MFSFYRALLCVLWFPHASLLNLDLPGRDRTSVSCSQGLSQCTVDDANTVLAPENGRVQVRKLAPQLKLRCRGSSPCCLCLLIDTELYISPDTLQDDDSTGSVTLCYQTPSALPTCKKVAFTINNGSLQQNLGKVSLVSNKPVGVSFGSEVQIYSLNPPAFPLQKISAPLLKEECARPPLRNIEECRAPEVLTQIHQDQVQLRLDGEAFGTTSVCVQYELRGMCQAWPHTTIPLPSVVPCLCIQVMSPLMLNKTEDVQTKKVHGLCLQAWHHSSAVRSLSCPFRETAFLYNNLWQNVTASAWPAHMTHGGTVMLWNLSAPCTLEGHVWPCERTTSHCREIQGFRQQLENHTWTQHKSGRWVNEGAFEDINLGLLPCVMVTLEGKGHQLGPFCFKHTERWHWSLLPVGLILLVVLVGIHICLFHGRIKGYIWGCRRDGFAKMRRRGHIVVISPPDVDAALSESVCGLGSSLMTLGFSVSVDQWCRKEQCRLGPLPWLHSQLLDITLQGGWLILVWTPTALEKTEQWTCQLNRTVAAKPTDALQTWGPRADIFTATLSLLQADKQLGRSRQHFLLVSFDSAQPAERQPQLLDRIPLFQLPSQMPCLLAQLTGNLRRRCVKC
ncbi:interleukin-17 receptor C-like isoform X1 [Synchiropus splendidus]|uniref:interleukin-17 receptor C-like isoform X1 n=1 Tax=Synchiropus splendidus TaxID=270530 RepID=UPI00237E5828|nr:interleukin-17 receptor C-like isoform X1 [Synchiropus splendidus]